jgi:CRP-like cAMP-binding protein
MAINILQALRSIELLAELPQRDIDQLTRFSLLRQVRAGETIFCQGEPSPYCFGIVSGEVTIQKENREKREIAPKVLSVLGPGVLFGEQALFTEKPRTATALAKRDGVLVAIQGKQFREWIAQDKDNGTPLLMGMFQSSLTRLRQTSDELSAVYGIGRLLAANKPIGERIREAVEFLKTYLQSVDEIIVYQRSPYWDEYQPVVDAPPSPDRPALPVNSALLGQITSALGPTVIKTAEERADNASLALVPLLNREDEEHPLWGFLWLASKNNSDAFTSNLLLLLSAVSVQFTEALLQQRRQEDQQAQSRLQQSRNSYPL